MPVAPAALPLATLGVRLHVCFSARAQAGHPACARPSTKAAALRAHAFPHQRATACSPRASSAVLRRRCTCRVRGARGQCRGGTGAAAAFARRGRRSSSAPTRHDCAVREGGRAVTQPEEERRVARDEAVEDDAEGRGEVLERVRGVLEQERDEKPARRVEANHRVGERAVPLQQA